jgi:hypothetical protein
MIAGEDIDGIGAVGRTSDIIRFSASAGFGGGNVARDRDREAARTK